MLVTSVTGIPFITTVTRVHTEVNSLIFSVSRNMLVLAWDLQRDQIGKRMLLLVALSLARAACNGHPKCDG
jgi:hypothetical protein